MVSTLVKCILYILSITFLLQIAISVPAYKDMFLFNIDLEWETELILMLGSNYISEKLLKEFENNKLKLSKKLEVIRWDDTEWLIVDKDNEGAPTCVVKNEDNEVLGVYKTELVYLERSKTRSFPSTGWPVLSFNLKEGGIGFFDRLAPIQWNFVVLRRKRVISDNQIYESTYWRLSVGLDISKPEGESFVWGVYIVPWSIDYKNFILGVGLGYRAKDNIEFTRENFSILVPITYHFFLGGKSWERPKN